MSNGSEVEAPAAIDPLLSVRQVAATLNVSKWTVYRLHGSGHLRGIYVGQQLRFERSVVDEFISIRRSQQQLRVVASEASIRAAAAADDADLDGCELLAGPLAREIDDLLDRAGASKTDDEESSA